MGAYLSLIKDHLGAPIPDPLVRLDGEDDPAGFGIAAGARHRDSNPIYERLGRHVDGLRLLATGPFTDDDLGVACYHSKVGAAELLLNHMIDGPGEYVVVDMTAGADAFASGMFTRFDLMLLVAEPTLRSVSVLRQYRTTRATTTWPSPSSATRFTPLRTSTSCANTPATTCSRG